MLGIDLSNELHKDFEVYGMDTVRKSESRIREYFECDITDEKKVSDVISRLAPDIVVHTAAMTDVDGCERDKDKAYKVNELGAGNVAQHAASPAP